jgi:hypothetical protein
MGKRRMEIEVRLKVPSVVVSRICRSGRRVCLSDCDREHWHKISIEDEANNAVSFFFFFLTDMHSAMSRWAARR